MKKSILILAILGVGLSGFAQKTHKVMGWKITKDVPMNELKINLPLAIFGSYPEISYERILNTDISVGAALGVSLDKERYPYQFMFTPHFRWFFGGNKKSMEKAGAGFFIEANGATYSRVMETYSNLGGTNVNENQKSIFGAGLGLALGWKYLSKNNWVGEIYGGAGRNFIKSDYADSEAYPRIGISIGKRF